MPTKCFPITVWLLGGETGRRCTPCAHPTRAMHTHTRAHLVLFLQQLHQLRVLLFLCLQDLLRVQLHLLPVLAHSVGWAAGRQQVCECHKPSPPLCQMPSPPLSHTPSPPLCEPPAAACAAPPAACAYAQHGTHTVSRVSPKVQCLGWAAGRLQAGPF